MNCSLLWARLSLPLSSGFVLGVVLCWANCCSVRPASGDDWPQWMGPSRDNIWRETGVLRQFPTSGLKVTWRSPVAGGYSGPAVAGKFVVVTDYVSAENIKVDNFDRKSFSGQERILCLSDETGEVVWKYEYPVTYSISYPAGPRCTPIIDGDYVYVLGAEGHLWCLEVKTGKVVWSKILPQDYNTKTPLWGYAAHPLLDGEQLICLCGGPGSHTIALDKRTGKEIWKSLTGTELGYSPPTLINAGGIRQLIITRPNAVSSIDPTNGKEFWSTDYEATNGSIIMSPVLWKDMLYVGGFSDKNLLLRLGSSTPSAEVLWRDKRKHGISPVNVQPMVKEGTLYGFDQNGTLYGMELASGVRLWETTQPVNSKRPVQSATAFMIQHGDHVWMFNEHGELLITKLTPEGYEELGRTKIIKPTNVAFGREVVWCAPAFAHRSIYVRNDEECLRISLAE